MYKKNSTNNMVFVFIWHLNTASRPMKERGTCRSFWYPKETFSGITCMILSNFVKIYRPTFTYFLLSHIHIISPPPHLHIHTETRGAGELVLFTTCIVFTFRGSTRLRRWFVAKKVPKMPGWQRVGGKS